MSTAGSLSAYCQTDGYITATFICNSAATTVYFYLGAATGTGLYHMGAQMRGETYVPCRCPGFQCQSNVGAAGV